MTIAEDLTRIQTAKADLKTAIEAHGVTVPSDALIDDYPELVAAIETPDWLGVNVEKVDDFYTKEYLLKNTGYASWTPSTTAASIVSSETVDTFSADTANYEYWIRWRACVDWKHLSGQTYKALPIFQAFSLWQNIHKKPYGFAEFETLDETRNQCVTGFSASSYIIYYNSSGNTSTGTKTWATGQNYGIYPSAVSVGFSSNTSDTPTITRKAPSFSARCTTTYFNVNRGQYVDQENTTIRLAGTMYRVKKGSSAPRHFFLDALDLVNHPLQGAQNENS